MPVRVCVLCGRNLQSCAVGLQRSNGGNLHAWCICEHAIVRLCPCQSIQPHIYICVLKMHSIRVLAAEPE